MRRLLALTLLLALGLAACGEDREESGGKTSTEGKTEETKAPAGKPVGTLSVKESEFKITPSKLGVAKSGVYEFKASNVGKTQHALEVEGNGVETETKTFGPGGKATLKVDLKPGTYELYCPVDDHKGQGMTATLTVGAKAAKGGASSGKTETESESEDDSGYGY